MKISRTTTLLGAFGLLLAAAMVYTTLLKPTYDKVLVLRGQIRGAQEEVERKESIASQIDHLLNKYKNVGPIRDEISKALPLDPLVPGVASQISYLTEKNLLSLASIKFSGTKIEGPPVSDISYGPGILTVNINLEGSYENLRAFISDIESNMRLMDIKSLAISSNRIRSTASRISGSSSDSKSSYQEDIIFAFGIEFDTYYQARELPASSFRYR